MRLFKSKVLKIFGHMREEVKEAGENDILKSFMVYTSNKTLLG